jgi:hypothetical protein
VVSGREDFARSAGSIKRFVRCLMTKNAAGNWPPSRLKEHPGKSKKLALKNCLMAGKSGLISSTNSHQLTDMPECCGFAACDPQSWSGVWCNGRTRRAGPHRRCQSP